MNRMRLGKTADSRSRKKKTEVDADIAILRKMANEKDRPKFAEYLLKKGHSASTVESLGRAVKRYLKWLKAENVPDVSATYNDILFFIQGRNGKVSQRTVQVEVNAIKHYYGHLCHIGLCLENPADQVRVKGVKRKILHNVLKKEELEKLYHDYLNLEKEGLAKKRNEAILGLLLYQGLNTSELSRLTTKDLKLREGKVFVIGTRRSNERTLQLEAHQILDLMEYTLRTRQSILEKAKKETEQLFVSFGHSKRFDGIMSKFLKELTKLNKKVKNVKQLRTSVIVHWLKHYNLRKVQYMTGHRYVSSTEAYLANDIDGLQEEIEKYHPI